MKNDPSRLPLWQQIISQYRPTFLSQCENAIKWSNDFVQPQLIDGMFEALPDKTRKAKSLTTALSDYPRNKSHDRHFHAEDCEKIGLTIKRLESDATF